MSALPAGALDALLNEGAEAFDRVIADDRAATQAAMKPEPVVAQNEYNQAKKDGKPTAPPTREATKSPRPSRRVWSHPMSRSR